MADHERDRSPTPEREVAREREPEAVEGLTRRRALQVLAAGAAGAAALSTGACADGSDSGVPDAEDAASFTGATSGGNPRAAGTPTDPDMVSPVVWWDLVLTEDELATLASLCDVIIPEDEHSPGAAALGAHNFIDEWVNAPYDGNRSDLVLVRGGLVWLDIESSGTFRRALHRTSTLDEKHAICDDICWEANAAPEYRIAARFFDRVRDLTSTAFWTTAEGMADLGFVGNRPMPTFDGPPPEVLERLGLA